jgi:uncharacterized membrane protein YdjX (TVP38/TMEM64 family)
MSSRPPEIAGKKNGWPPYLKTLVFVLEIALVAALLVVWFTNDDFRTSKNLWVLFFYSFPAEFLIAIVPHEPMLLYFGKFYSPFTVGLVAVASTLLTEALNYSTFKYVADLKSFAKVQTNRWVVKLIDLFNRAPFAALWVAGFTPIPFYPFRFMVVMARYPLWKYLLATFLSRTPRFFILAYVGHSIRLSDTLLVVLFAAMLAVIYLPLLRRRKKSRRASP